MRTATCVKCGYLLEGLAPVPEGFVVCPECSQLQKSDSGTPRKPRKGYFVGLVASVVVQAACLMSSHYLGTLHRPKGSLGDQFMYILISAAPAIGAVAYLAAIIVVRRPWRPDSRISWWRTVGLLVLALLANGVIWVVLLVVGYFMFSNRTMLGSGV